VIAHISCVNTIVFSPDSARFASGCDADIRLWDTVTTSLIMTFAGHSSWVSSVDFSPDGSVLASGSDDETVRTWNAVTGASINTITRQSSVNCVAFSRNGSRLVSAVYQDIQVNVGSWPWTNLANLKGHIGGVFSAAFSRNGWLVSGGEDGNIRVWDSDFKARSSGLDSHSAEITYITASLDGSLIASGSRDNTVRVWDSATGRLLANFARSAATTCMAFSPDGSSLAVGGWMPSHSAPETVQLFEWKSNSTVISLPRNPASYDQSLAGIAYSPDGTRIALVGFGNNVQLWDAALKTQIRSFRGHGLGSNVITAPTFSLAKPRLLAFESGDSIQVWDTVSGESVCEADSCGQALSLAFTPDGSSISFRSRRGRGVVTGKIKVPSGVGEVDEKDTSIADVAERLLPSFLAPTTDIIRVGSGSRVACGCYTGEVIIMDILPG